MAVVLALLPKFLFYKHKREFNVQLNFLSLKVKVYSAIQRTGLILNLNVRRG